MSIRQTRIFVPNSSPFYNHSWAENVLGKIIKPLVENNADIKWFWFSRYASPRQGDSGDCEISNIPQDFEINGVLRSIRFRFEIPDEQLQNFENEGQDIVTNERCMITDWRNFNLLADLGGTRFVGEIRDEQRKMERANLVVSFLHNLSKLILHSLIGPDQQGCFRLEGNDDRENPQHSSFESLHHLFCNMTEVPLRILIFAQGNQRTVGTDWSAPKNGWNVVDSIPVRF